VAPEEQRTTIKAEAAMARSKVLLVDDDKDEIFLTQRSLEAKNFEVVSVTGVTEAFKQIATQSFDVLITDLHMPEPGDGFAVVTAMRHSQPEALTLVVSGFPDVQRSMSAILLQADEVLVKPFDVEQLAELLHQKVLDSKASPKKAKESVASILERDATITVQRWLSRVEQVGELNSLPLTADERTDHLPDIIKNIATRLRKLRVIEAVATTPSPAAVAHGRLRHRQGYTAPLMVQESRILQVCIFETIQRNLSTVDFGLVLPDIMLIADEVDSQLAQSIDSFLMTQRGGALGAPA
jgi:ActR/RegA family two-component response regulator